MFGEVLLFEDSIWAASGYSVVLAAPQIENEEASKEDRSVAGSL